MEQTCPRLVDALGSQGFDRIVEDIVLLVRTILICVAVWLAGCGRQPPLPIVDTHRLPKAVANAVINARAKVDAAPNDTALLQTYCMTLQANDLPEPSIPCYRRLLKRGADAIDVQFYLGQALLDTGKPAEAAKLFEQALHEQPKNEFLRLRLAEALRGVGDKAASLAQCKQVLASYPSPEGYLCMGQAESGDAAIEDLRKALRFFPRYGAAQLALASEYRNRGDAQRALEVMRNYERDRFMSPYETDALYAKLDELNVTAAGIFRQAQRAVPNGRILESIRLYRQALQADPHLVEAWVNLMKLHMQLKEPNEVEADYLQAVALQPSRVDINQEYAAYKLKTSEVDAAERVLQNAVKYAPMNPEALYSLGVLREGQGRYDEAKTLFKQVLALSPKLAMAHYHLARLQARRGEWQSAIASLDRESQSSGDDAWIYQYAIGVVYAQKGEYKIAKKMIERGQDEAATRLNFEVMESAARELGRIEALRLKTP